MSPSRLSSETGTRGGTDHGYGMGDPPRWGPLGGGVGGWGGSSGGRTEDGAGVGVSGVRTVQSCQRRLWDPRYGPSVFEKVLRLERREHREDKRTGVGVHPVLRRRHKVRTNTPQPPLLTRPVHRRKRSFRILLCRNCVNDSRTLRECR